MFKKENFHNKTEHKYQNKEKRKWGVLTLHIEIERDRRGGLKNGDGLSMIWITDLEYAGSVWSPPGIQEVVLASADEPLAAVGELEGEDTALVEVELVLVWLTAVEYLHITALHSEKNSFIEFIQFKVILRRVFLGAFFFLQISCRVQIFLKS